MTVEETFWEGGEYNSHIIPAAMASEEQSALRRALLVNVVRRTESAIWWLAGDGDAYVREAGCAVLPTNRKSGVD